MADEELTPPAEPTVLAEPTPGWSNSPANNGISALEGPPVPLDMNRQGWSNNGPTATGATAGIPGAWTPAPAEPVATFGGSMGAIVASPATAWTTGQYVLLGDGTFAHWNGTNWIAGKKP
jgi:hypothetical protein